MSAEPNPIRKADAFDTLAALSAGLSDELSPVGDVVCVQPSEMSEVYRRLLVHTNHMTPTLQDFHGEAVELRVLAYHDDDRWYHRKILLTTGGGRWPVEFGLVRLDLSALPDSVRKAVLERRQPLGDILIANGVMTEVEPRWYLRFAAGHPVVGYLAPASGGACFGRVATIHCDGRAAMELLEVVTDARAER